MRQFNQMQNNNKLRPEAVRSKVNDNWINFENNCMI